MSPRSGFSRRRSVVSNVEVLRLRALPSVISFTGLVVPDEVTSCAVARLRPARGHRDPGAGPRSRAAGMASS
jgi:hypothetical protein